MMISEAIFSDQSIKVHNYDFHQVKNKLQPLWLIIRCMLTHYQFSFDKYCFFYIAEIILMKMVMMIMVMMVIEQCFKELLFLCMVYAGLNHQGFVLRLDNHHLLAEYCSINRHSNVACS